MKAFEKWKKKYKKEHDSFDGVIVDWHIAEEAWKNALKMVLKLKDPEVDYLIRIKLDEEIGED